MLGSPASFKGIQNELLIYLYVWDSLLQTFIFRGCYFLNAQWIAVICITEVFSSLIFYSDWILLKCGHAWDRRFDTECKRGVDIPIVSFYFHNSQTIESTCPICNTSSPSESFEDGA